MLRFVPGTARFGHSNMASGGCGLDDLLRHRARGFAPPRREVWASFAKPRIMAGDSVGEPYNLPWLVSLYCKNIFINQIVIALARSLL